MASDSRIASDKLFLIIAVILVTMGIAYAYLTSPTWLTVAIGPAGSPEDKLLRAFAGQLRKERIALRLRVLPVSDVAAAAEALDRGRADLAVVRSDVRVPETGLTLTVLRDPAVIVVAPRESGIGEISGLAGQTLGLVAGHEGDSRFLELILAHFDLTPPAVKIVSLRPEDVMPKLTAGEIGAVALLGQPAEASTSEFVRSVANALSGQVKVLPIENASAISQRSPGALAASIPEGAWGGRPKIPDVDTKSVSVSYRLMARSDLDRSTAALVTESLFQMRSRLTAVARSAMFMRAPDLDTAAAATSAPLPNHPGAVDYFQREQLTVMDRYGDWIYLGAFFGSALISLAAGMRQRLRRHRREAIDDVLDRLLAVLSDARSAESERRLDELTAEVDDLLAISVQHARSGDAGSRTTSALLLALDGARAAIDDRRAYLGHARAAPRRYDDYSRLAAV